MSFFDRYYKANVFAVRDNLDGRTYTAFGKTKGKARLAALALARDAGATPITRPTVQRMR